MNRIEKGKRSLIIMSITTGILSIAASVFSIFLIVWGAKGLIEGSKSFLIPLEIVGGGLLLVCSLIVLAISIVFLITGKSLKAMRGSIKEDNLGKGTANAVLCDKCGEEIGPNAQYCVKCGQENTLKVTCKHCGAVCDKGGVFCEKCGKAL